MINPGRIKQVREIISRLGAAGSEGPIQVEGTWGAFAHLLAVYVSEKLARPLLYVCPHIDDADKAVDDMQTFGCENVSALAAWDAAEEPADATDEVRTARARTVLRTASGNRKFIVAAPVQGLCQQVPSVADLKESMLKLKAGKKMPLQRVIGWLIDNSYERTEKIDLPGQFAHRGGIVDIYVPVVSEMVVTEDGRVVQAGEAAVRVEFFGDTIESIRQINLDTQRSSGQVEEVGVISATAASADKERREQFLNVLPEDTVVMIEEPAECEDVGDVFVQRCEEDGRLFRWSDIYRAAGRFEQVHICRFAGAASDDYIKLPVQSVQRFQHKAGSLWAGHKETLRELVGQAKAGRKVFLYCESAAEIRRLKEVIKQNWPPLPKKFNLVKGFVNAGFTIESPQVIVVSHHELFGQYALRRRPGTVRAPAAISSLSDLNEGDYVVHSSYGIGRFCGIKSISGKQGRGEYLTIAYADDVKVQVSVRNIGLVQKYIGTSPKRPRLSKIGSKRWRRQKANVTRAVEDLASELLEVQAKRESMAGISYQADSEWQMEFEESFAYQETVDQTTAAAQIKKDMEYAVAMDRLLCGDVGYGKTELAMRATFKAVDGGRQVAVLAPTTVLSVQHGRCFAERFADFPVCVEVLNRFKTAKQAKDIISRTRQGRVDVLIGTHRLFSSDVGFSNLGLLIIDEEQRFGVADKEKLKKMRHNVDILTMTATPIPRTLNMSILGLRDISSLTTPPLDRHSIVTKVTRCNRELVRKAIIRELTRQGQVFFLHNRVRTIGKKALEIQKIVPEARVAVAHGQMAKSELEMAMVEFVEGRIDVLVCTTIIESGLDIPNANTIFIDNADRFGLAELHQLRGRVGRYKHRAYAYMLMPENRTVSPIAARRLKAIEEYSHLGAGFRIALRDLEIRGAGNILGPQQSGHIQMVGYQMYCELLAEAVKRLKNEPVEKIPEAVIELGFSAYIPKNYIPDNSGRMDVYRRIATAGTEDILEDIRNELGDVYGAVPDEVELLLKLADIRQRAALYGIKAVTALGTSLMFSFDKSSAVGKRDLLFKDVKAKVDVIDAGTVYVRLDENYLEPDTIMAFLRKILSG